ncbi:MAG: SAM-dependent methyltransferase [Rhodospirillum sp.]|nr:SAM-dependent methyltransferase [Rhodospirillum sp.]MCF8488686.1 SAM-dependent methyltransferase [Rhodospirillum sp.]MCF8501548.1 SAM-dependent methyltransferase [Rhodospirillum sp.]
MAREGAVSVEDWMGACLAAYYGKGSAIGAKGDFVTAPECTQMVGELLGLWSAVVWRSMGCPARVLLVELGPGRGTLMTDALRALAPVPPFKAALEVHLVETSPGLRVRQKEALRESGVAVTWHDRVEDLPDGPMILLANEFLDALPIRQFQRAGQGWRERLVAPREGDPPFAFVAGSPLTDRPALLRPAHDAAKDGQVVEVCPAAHETVRWVSTRIVEQGGAALFLDYGTARSAPGDSLQALRRHAFAPVLADPGEADLTAHVDFEALAGTAVDAGARVDGVMRQGPFLQALGLEQRAQTLLASAAARQREDITSAVRRLIDPAEMGTLFKVFGLRHPALALLPGF